MLLLTPLPPLRPLRPTLPMPLLLQATRRWTPPPMRVLPLPTRALLLPTPPMLLPTPPRKKLLRRSKRLPLVA